MTLHENSNKQILKKISKQELKALGLL